MDGIDFRILQLTLRTWIKRLRKPSTQNNLTVFVFADSSDEEEGEIISDDENNGPQEKPKEEKRAPEEKKSTEPRPMSIGDIAARIQEQNALRMASSLDRMQHDDDRSRKRHHKKDKRRRRNSHSEEDSPHRKHVSISSMSSDSHMRMGLLVVEI